MLVFRADNQGLGLRVSAAGAQLDRAKIEVFGTWPVPLYTSTDLQMYLDLVSYYRSFVRGFACIATPFTDWFKKEKQKI